VTYDYEKGHTYCPVMMRAGFDLLDAHALDPLTYPSLKTIFNLCTMP
jgi:hypothetical protein